MRAARIRIYRPTSGIGYFAAFRVQIDGADQGDLWSRQVVAVSVAPGQHVIQLKQGLFLKSRQLAFEVKEGEVIDFACSRVAALTGFIGLHRANADERELIERLKPATPPPIT